MLKLTFKQKNPKNLYNRSYIQLYKMKKTRFHSPTLESVIMVEESIKDSDNI